MGVLNVMRLNNTLPFHSNWVFVWTFLLILTILMLVLLVLTWNLKTSSWIIGISEKISSLKISKPLSLTIFTLLILIIPCIVLFLDQLPTGVMILMYSRARILLLWFTILAAALVTKISRKDLSWPGSLTVTVIVQALILSFLPIVSVVNNFPFSLSWSDTSNYYRASTLFASRIYGIKMALPVMHATQNFLMAVPFFFGNLPIWVHRAWEAILSVVFPLALGIVFIRRFKLIRQRMFWLMVAWAVLFLMQGPIHIHLLACAIIFVWGVKPQKFWLTTLVVVFASIWAGMSRINWYPVPGLFAAVLYLLEVPYETSRSWLRYLWKPVFWFIVGLATAFAGQFTYVLVSGNASHPGDAFSSLTSDLLWYRLFPNATNSAGVLPSAFIVSLPLLAIIIYSLWRRQRSYHPLRILGIFSALLVLFLGGLVVSIKIGGGSDLHNLDAFLILLMLVGGYFYFGRMTPESERMGASIPYPTFMIALTILFPVWMAVKGVSPIMTWDHQKADQVLESVRSQTESVSRTGGEVLFITQRQLLALKIVNVPLVSDYEQDYLMEMVMSHNRSYLDRFHQDLQAQRFKMIVASAYSDILQGSGSAFGNENDLWVQEVVIPLECYYQVLPGFNNQPVTLYVPRAQPCK
jgi:hypothetical protein